MDRGNLSGAPSSQRRGFTDLGLARGTVTDALVAAAVRAALFVVVPVLIVALLSSGPQSDQTLAGLREVRTNALVFGTALVVV